MNTPNLSLRFYNWQCGHHGQRPGDIAVSSPEQATQILHAMSHCISQPGSFQAWLMDDIHAVSAYVTDDYVRVNLGDQQQFPQWDSLGWEAERPVLIYGTEAQIAELRHPDNAEAVSCLWFFDALPTWDGTEFLDDNVATTTLTLAELQHITRSRDWFEPNSPELFALPPVFKTAESALEEVREERASITADRADIEACKDDTGIFDTASIADMDRAHGKVALRQVFDETSVQASVPLATNDQGDA